MMLLTLASFFFSAAQAYHGPLDFNCTKPPLDVIFTAPLGSIVCGQKMLKTNPALATAPHIKLPTADATKGYVLMMIDPDAPSRASPTYSPIRHWLVGNVPGSALIKGDVGGKDGKGDTLSPYHPPGPPAGTGYHRYGQFIFEQPKPHVAFKSVAPSIAKWNYSAFIKQYNLVGDKLSSNYLLAEAGPDDD